MPTETIADVGNAGTPSGRLYRGDAVAIIACRGEAMPRPPGTTAGVCNAGDPAGRPYERILPALANMSG